MNPALIPLFLAKTDMHDGFYRIDLVPSDVPKLGLIFTQVSKSSNHNYQLVVPTLVLLLVWPNSSPMFYTATETGADIANTATHSN